MAKNFKLLLRFNPKCIDPYAVSACKWCARRESCGASSENEACRMGAVNMDDPAASKNSPRFMVLAKNFMTMRRPTVQAK
jgi:hypothetical protein